MTVKELIAQFEEILSWRDSPGSQWSSESFRNRNEAEASLTFARILAEARRTVRALGQQDVPARLLRLAGAKPRAAAKPSV